MHMYGTHAAHQASMQGPAAQAYQCMARPDTRQHPASTATAAGDTHAAHCSSSQAPLYSKHKAVAQLHTPPLACAQFKLQRPHVRRLPQHPRAQGFAPRICLRCSHQQEALTPPPRRARCQLTRRAAASRGARRSPPPGAAHAAGGPCARRARARGLQLPLQLRRLCWR